MERRKYNEHERRLIRAGKPSQAKEAWTKRYNKAPLAAQRKAMLNTPK